jgi:hypothetical protein
MTVMATSFGAILVTMVLSVLIELTANGYSVRGVAEV